MDPRHTSLLHMARVLWLWLSPTSGSFDALHMRRTLQLNGSRRSCLFTIPLEPGFEPGPCAGLTNRTGGRAWSP